MWLVAEVGKPEERNGGGGAGDSGEERDGEGLRGVERGAAVGHQGIGNNDDGIIDEVCYDIDQQGTAVEVEISQKSPQEESRQEGEDFAMGEAEERRRHPYRRMGILEPLLQKVLDTDTKEEFLTDGGDKSHAEEAEEGVTLPQKGVDQLLRLLAGFAEAVFQSLPSA